MIKKLEQMLEREERNKTWLARQVGVSPACIFYWFNGKNKPKEKHLTKLLEILDNHKQKGE